MSCIAVKLATSHGLGIISGQPRRLVIGQESQEICKHALEAEEGVKLPNQAAQLVVIGPFIVEVAQLTVFLMH